MLTRKALSVKMTVSLNWKRDSSLIVACNLEAKTAACSSSRGIVIFLRGATLHLAAMNLMSNLSLCTAHLMQAHAPNAS